MHTSADIDTCPEYQPQSDEQHTFQVLFEPVSASAQTQQQQHQPSSDTDPSIAAASSQQYNFLIDAQREPVRFLQSLIDALYRLEQLPNALNDLFDHLYIGLYSCVRTASKAINDRCLSVYISSICV